MLDVSALHEELVALAEAHDTAIRRDDLTKAICAHTDLHVHVLRSLRISGQVEWLLAFWHICLHVLVEDLVVPVEVLLLRLVQLLELLLRHHQTDLPTQLFYPLQAKVQVRQQAPPVAVDKIVVQAKAGSHLPRDAIQVRVLGDQALHLPRVIQDLLDNLLHHLVVKLWEPARSLEVFQELHGLLHVQNHGGLGGASHAQAPLKEATNPINPAD
mmetsp:Transcript_28690/g.77785  ORF Transcript_28690/g.77785 Transcript_28690/m.77785 type:complete len:214 (-) Transcript_28690:24-665(-)